MVTLGFLFSEFSQDFSSFESIFPYGHDIHGIWIIIQNICIYSNIYADSPYGFKQIISLLCYVGWSFLNANDWISHSITVVYIICNNNAYNLAGMFCLLSKVHVWRQMSLKNRRCKMCLEGEGSWIQAASSSQCIFLHTDIQEAKIFVMCCI